MAVEEVCILRVFRLPIYSHIFTKEFGIEIPDAEADEIQTVQQGKAISDRQNPRFLNCFGSYRLHIQDSRRSEITYLFIT